VLKPVVPAKAAGIVMTIPVLHLQGMIIILTNRANNYLHNDMNKITMPINF
jgi:hypothetical protein